MKYIPSLEADNHLGVQGSSPCSQKPASGGCAEPDEFNAYISV
jgi:hypothetical protein